MSNHTLWHVVAVPLWLCSWTVAQSVVLAPALPIADPVPVGDVDGDGCSDYSGVSAGTAFVHSGATGAVIAHFTRAAASYEYFGRAGDMNADGHDDVVWLAASGTATVVSGVDGATLWSWPTASDGSAYGTGIQTIAIQGGADFDVDGFDDVVLRCNNTVYDIRSGRTGQVIHTGHAGQYPVTPGFVIGDLEGDGVPDLTISEPAFSNFTIVRGLTFATTVLNLPSRCWVGDVNCNGTLDVVVGATAASSEVRDGGTNQLLGTLPFPMPLSGTPVLRPAGDVDGDGHDDFHSASPLYLGVPAWYGIGSGATLARLAGSQGTVFRSTGDIDGDGRVEVTNGGAYEWTDPTLPVASRLVRRGGAGVTSIGTKLRMQTRGSCALGESLFFDVRGMLPNGLALFILGAPIDVDLAPLGAPGNRSYATFGGLLVLLANASGVCVQSFAMPVDPALLGSSVATQAALFDTAANALNFVTSNAIDVYTNN